MTKKIFSFIFLFFSFPIFCLPLDDIIKNADEAINAENWEKALEILQEGIKEYPAADQLLLMLGTIYYNKELFSPAYKTFKKGLHINNSNTSLLYYASSSAAFLNKPNEALEYIKKYVQLVPEDRFGWANYGWLCFKCHKEQEGINALLKNIKQYGDDASVCNSLGTLYSEIFDYENAHKFYSKAIKIANALNRKEAVSIYSYNKAILERQFYKFDQALEDAKFALQMHERNSSYMMIAEMEDRRNNLQKALSAYIKAAAIDDTPLAALGIADTYLKAGHTEQAEEYILSQLQNKNESWISNYGLSVTEFKNTLYELQQKLYEQKYNYEKTRLTVNPLDSLKNLKDKINYKLKSNYYDSLQRTYKLKAAKEYKIQAPSDINNPLYVLRINSYYYPTFKDKGKKALKYLEKSEKIETDLIPKSAASYIAEKGIYLKDLSLINKGINSIDQEWERFLLKDLYGEGIKIAIKKSPELYNIYLESMYDINPAGFLDFDIKLPVNINVDVKTLQVSENKIKKLIKSSRFIYRPDSKFELYIVHKNSILTFRLLKKGGGILYENSTKIEKLSLNKFKSIINENVKKIFSVKL